MMSQNLKFIFVHGLSGWGSYDNIDRYFPYWGLSGGSVIKYLRKLGYELICFFSGLDNDDKTNNFIF